MQKVETVIQQIFILTNIFGVMTAEWVAERKFE